MGNFFINRPIFAMVISIIIVVAGLVVLRGLPVAQYPDIAPPQIDISTSYIGADAQTIEEAVATPLEQKINGVENMLYVTSISSNDGSMTINVLFDVEADPNMSQVLVQNRVSQATSSLPVDVKNWGVTVQKSSSLPIVLFNLYSPNDTYDKLFLSNYATINVIDELTRLPGVGQVSVLGAQDYAMRIWLQPDKLVRFGLTATDVIRAIQSQNTVNPAGQIGAEPAPKDNEFTLTVRTKGRLLSPEEFSNITIKENIDGSSVKIKDIAKTELGALTYAAKSKYNQKPCAIVAVYQVAGSNALDVANASRIKMKELSERFPNDVVYEVGLDTTEPITAGISEITETLFIAIGLVLLVVFIFLQSWRATIIPMVTVPVSLLGTFMFFPLFGFSVNTLSLFGLVLAIGLVVDDAIVVVEAVEHHIDKGLSPKEATKKALSEITGPVIATTLILASVFIPIVFIEGIVGRMYQQFALTIAISVIISTFNALTLSPALCALILKPKNEDAREGLLKKFFNAFNSLFNRTKDAYVNTSDFLLRKGSRSIGLLILTVVLVLVLGKITPSGFIPLEDVGYFNINVTLPEAASLQRTDKVMEKIDNLLKDIPSVENIISVSGYSMLTGTASTYSGFYFIKLKHWDQRKAKGLKADQIMDEINIKLAGLKEAVAFAFPSPPVPGLGKVGGIDFILQDRSGGTPDFLYENLTKFMDDVQKRPEIASVNTLYKAHVPQLYADIDREKIFKLGVDISSVYLVMQAFLGGAYVNDFNQFGRQWKVFVQADSQYRNKIDNIGSFFVRNKNGGMVPLSTLIDVKEITGPEFLYRFNLFRSAEIFANPAEGYSSGQAIAAIEDVAKNTLPKEMGYDWGGVTYQEKKASGSVFFIFGLSLLFVFLILAAQYESWSLPFSVLLGTPIAVLGALFGLYIRSMPNDIFSQIGLVMLIGLAAKNAILIVAHAKSAVDNDGMGLREAAISGVERRLRPILMTAFAFILGCLPLWFADGSGALSRRSLGTTVIMGMILATLVEILIVPALFYLIGRISSKKKSTSGFKA
jgi:hydrophobic/amphiphilic exporter-1 (mainly G- bacteria), HAE1 family